MGKNCIFRLRLSQYSWYKERDKGVKLILYLSWAFVLLERLVTVEKLFSSRNGSDSLNGPHQQIFCCKGWHFCNSKVCSHVSKELWLRKLVRGNTSALHTGKHTETDISTSCGQSLKPLLFRFLRVTMIIHLIFPESNDDHPSEFSWASVGGQRLLFHLELEVLFKHRSETVSLEQAAPGITCVTR